MKNKLLLCAMPVLMAGLLSGCPKQSTEIDENGEEIIVVEKDSSEGLVYQYNREEDSYMVTNYLGNATGVVIPETYNGKAVTRIEDYAFRNNLVIKKIVISKNVKEIGHFAFSRAYNLDKIEIAKGNETFVLDDGLVYNTEKDTIYFGEAHRYEHLIVPDSVKTLRYGCFGNFENLTFLDFDIYQIETGGGHTSTLGELFSSESYQQTKYSVDKMKNNIVPNLENVNVRNGATSPFTNIPSYFFNGCKTLTHIKLEGSAFTSISGSAFSNCVSLRELEYGECADKISSVGDYAFYNCVSLNAIYFGSKMVPDTIKCNIFYGCRPEMRLYYAASYSSNAENWAYYKNDSYSKIQTSSGSTYANYLKDNRPVVKIDLSQYDDYAPAPTV